MDWMTWVLFVGLMWISPGKSYRKDETSQKLKNCFSKNNTIFVLPDCFNGVINITNYWNMANGCIIFLQKDRKGRQEIWPRMEVDAEKNADFLIHLQKWHIDSKLYVLQGEQCNATISDSKFVCDKARGPCKVTCLDTKALCHSTFDEKYCNSLVPRVMDKYIINVTAPHKDCYNCNNPVKKPEVQLGPSDLRNLNITFEVEGEQVNPSQAADVMKKMSHLATSINVSSVALNVGEGVTGILVRETEPSGIKEVSFAYVSPNDSINIIENRDSLAQFSRSVTLPEEAFEKSNNFSVSAPFVAFFRFINMAMNETNRVILENEVLAIEMGTSISNLTDKISINVQNTKYEGIPSCQSWDGEGSQPKWTRDGCRTIKNGDNITCQCSHLTFFAILLSPLNETTSTYDLNNLTIITQVGCGLSMLFLSIVLFMHFLVRRTKASEATRILIHLVSAMFLLNFTFLINNFVAELKSSVGCKIMAALMHYFMLATFTLFAVQAFHLCLQLYAGGKIVIRHYMLKVTIASWVLPSVVGIVLLIFGKYGEQVIHSNDTEESVTMCWITDSTIHYIVNIGYYGLVFLFTFITFIIILSWLTCLRRTNINNAQVSRGGRSIVTVLGLCCLLGITWGFAFFAHGILQIPAYYIFTVLNSFQGFLLFIYYYNTSHSGEVNGSESSLKNLNTTTLDTSTNSFENPFINLPGKKKGR